MALRVGAWAGRQERLPQVVARSLAGELLLRPSEGDGGWFVIRNPGRMLGSTEVLLKVTSAQGPPQTN